MNKKIIGVSIAVLVVVAMGAAVLTYDWEAPANKISELISSSDNGDSWKKEADIPMPHVMHMTYADGFYFCGGRHGEFGKVFYWR